MKAIKYLLLVYCFACASSTMAVDYKLHQTSSAKVKSTSTPVYDGTTGPNTIFYLAPGTSYKVKGSVLKNCFHSTSAMPRTGSSLPQAAVTGVTTTCDNYFVAPAGPKRVRPGDNFDPHPNPIGDALLPLLLLVAVYVVFDMRKRRNQLDKQTE